MGRGDDVSFYCCRALDRFEPLSPVHDRSSGYDLRNRFAVAGDANGFTSDTNLLEECEALGFELRNGNFDHGSPFDHIIDYGQNNGKFH